MKNGTFGKEKDIPIQKKDEKNLSDEIDLDLGEDDDDVGNSENKNKKEENQRYTNMKQRTKALYAFTAASCPHCKPQET